MIPTLTTAQALSAADALLVGAEKMAMHPNRYGAHRIYLKAQDRFGIVYLRHLTVYGFGHWYGYPGKTAAEMDGFQYIEWCRDEAGWSDNELTRDGALYLLQQDIEAGR